MLIQYASKVISISPSSIIPYFCITESFCKDYYPTNEKHDIIRISNNVLHKLALSLCNSFQTIFNVLSPKILFFFYVRVSFRKDYYHTNEKREIFKISNIILHKLALLLDNMF